MGIIKDIYDVSTDLADRFGRRKKDRTADSESLPPQRGSEGITWQQYDKLYDIEGYRVAYLPILNSWKGELRFLSPNDVSVTQLDVRFTLGQQFGDAIQPPPTAFDGNCCRLSDYDFSEGHLSLIFQETSYFDYFRSGEQLDAAFPTNPSVTNRQAFGTLVEKGQAFWTFTHLTNITGVGVFVKTSDNYIVGGTVAGTSNVYPGRRTYSASGVMAWDKCQANPFEAATNKCHAKIGYSSRAGHLKLISFGADARKLYFQVSFLEESPLTIDAFRAKYGNSATLHQIPLDPDAVVSRLLQNCWEPAAEASLLTICLNEFGPESLYKALFARRSEWEKREMRDEWDYRASRPGDLPDMSLRYDPRKLESESKRYVESVVEFLGDSLDGADVVEVGCGTGRITERLLAKASTVTCVEFCERMIQRNKERLGVKSDLARYVAAFGQEYYPDHCHDVAICSLVLIHNVAESDFRKLVESLCRIAKRVFVFEDVKSARSTSPRTLIRSKQTLIRAFMEYRFSLVRQASDYHLFSDDISFMEFANLSPE